MYVEIPMLVLQETLGRPKDHPGLMVRWYVSVLSGGLISLRPKNRVEKHVLLLS